MGRAATAPRSIRSTSEQLGLFGASLAKPRADRPCEVCDAWGAFGMEWPLTPKPRFWCREHLPADYWTRKPA